MQAQALFLMQNDEARSHLSESEARFVDKYTALYQRHVQREAWDLKEADGIPDAVKDLFRIELLLTKPNLDAHVRA